MKIYLEKIIFINRVPFDNLELDFCSNEIAILSATNGKGKTTILSHIVDAFHEIAKLHFKNEYEGKVNKFYRISSPIYNLSDNLSSIVYLRFKINDENFDYLDLRNKCTEDEYNKAITIENKIPFNQFSSVLERDNVVKKVSSNFNKENTQEIFINNLITYFPAYRYEQPGYLNEPYKIKLDFKKESGFSGYLNNSIEVLSGLPKLANWIMDIILDMQYTSTNVGVLKQNLDTIITESLSSKNHGRLRFGVGPRGFGSTRIQIIKDEENEECVCPTIFNLSSGETSLLCLFGEILKQADTNKNNVLLTEITGIVIVDEIEKHLHIKLQKEVLPRLLKLFPNVQFILSSHSPFLSMGLADELQNRSKIIDLDNFGISKDPTTNNLYKEVYEMMVGENDRFKESYILLENKIKEGLNPIIITEGKTDIQHIKNAKEKLEIDLEIDFYEITEDWGDSKLQTSLEYFSKINQPRRIIGIFDRDNGDIVNKIEKNSQPFYNYGNNVYAFCIPLVNETLYGNKISIEHYYPLNILKKENTENRRLFLGNEFYHSGNSKDGCYQTKIKQIKNKVDINGIIDEKVYLKDDLKQEDSIALTKHDFSLLTNDSTFIENFDFINFRPIFDIITSIVQLEN